MSVYAEKRAGKLTGKFRVEMQRGKDRYRQRHETLQAAQEDESRVLALWDQGGALGVPAAPQRAPEGLSLREAIKLAKRGMWRDSRDRDHCFSQVERLAEALGMDTGLDDIGNAEFTDALEVLDDRGVSNGTCNRYISRFRTFLAWCIAEKHRKVSLGDINWKGRWRKEAPSRMRYITWEEEPRLLACLPPATAKLVQVAIDTGCRREELLTLRPYQVYPTHLSLTKVKNDAPRDVPIGAETYALLQDLVVNGEMPSLRCLRRHWDAARVKLGLGEDKQFVFHICRHTFGTRMVEAGVNLLIIKKLMGHKRIETTERYAKVNTKSEAAAILRVGELRSQMTGKPIVSAVPTVPHASPTGGVKGPKTEAA